ncbi:hypothetical protein BFX40_20245 [Mesorhizobium sp. SEMIA 3007]|uniref:hypothetical protein n=1 Tax=Mesorhizobium sp. SEMIA 3007 TaxID=1862350 RepID=UPI00083DA9DC|nr:hypothetical protein [Mesorhizobium sp. SEMIA 3007]ODA94966.1 hypothetical protein BFX40_20245 [Mesorhizobium sp. SEMIA 3007]
MTARLDQVPRSLEQMTVPPGGRTQLICKRWPDCLCGDDCIDLAPAESPMARRILNGLMLAVAAIGAGLVYVGLH